MTDKFDPRALIAAKLADLDDPNVQFVVDALERALAKFAAAQPEPGSLGAIGFMLSEALVACAEVRQDERRLIASGISKLAPDIAPELAAELGRRLTAAGAEQDEALKDFLGVLRAE